MDRALLIEKLSIHTIQTYKQHEWHAENGHRGLDRVWIGYGSCEGNHRGRKGEFWLVCGSGCWSLTSAQAALRRGADNLSRSSTTRGPLGYASNSNWWQSKWVKPYLQLYVPELWSQDPFEHWEKMAALAIHPSFSFAVPLSSHILAQLCMDRALNQESPKVGSGLDRTPDPYYGSHPDPFD